MKIDKAERILENFIEEKSCPENVREAIKTVLAENIRQYHRVNFAQAYLTGMETLGKEDVLILRQGVT